MALLAGIAAPEAAAWQGCVGMALAGQWDVINSSPSCSSCLSLSQEPLVFTHPQGLRPSLC